MGTEIAKEFRFAFQFHHLQYKEEGIKHFGKVSKYLPIDVAYSLRRLATSSPLKHEPRASLIYRS